MPRTGTDSTDVVAWLLDGDPVIRWQTQRDLCDASNEVWQAERRRTLDIGWGASYLSHLPEDGDWPVGRWIGSPWSYLLVMDCGLPADYPPLRSAAHRFLDRCKVGRPSGAKDWKLVDLCHLGFWLRIATYFDYDPQRSSELAGAILDEQMPDGGWNCRKRRVPKTRHSSLHTTLNVLEGLRPTAEASLIGPQVFRDIEARSVEFLLAHKLYRSDKTGEVINERFTHLTYPSHWHYTVLRGLDYLRATPVAGDDRLADPVALLVSRRLPNGRWPVEKRIPGLTLFDMEKFGGESRWNTLRAMRVLRQTSV